MILKWKSVHLYQGLEEENRKGKLWNYIIIPKVKKVIFKKKSWKMCSLMILYWYSLVYPKFEFTLLFYKFKHSTHRKSTAGLGCKGFVFLNRR